MTAPWGAEMAQAAAALAGVLLLLWGAARLAARRLGTGPRAAAGRRLGLGESLPLDARRRVVILRVDGREALLLTGGAQDVFLGWL